MSRWFAWFRFTAFGWSPPQQAPRVAVGCPCTPYQAELLARGKQGPPWLDPWRTPRGHRQ